MTTQLPITILQEYDKNPRSINKDDFMRLKYRLSSMLQMKPLLVTPNEDGTYTVLGGNMRLKALRELATEQPEKYQNIWVIVVEFKTDTPDNFGGWYAVINGVRSDKTFISKEDAMMEYSLLDNERSGFYDTDLVANLMPEFNIDWDYAVDFKSVQSIETMVNAVAPEDSTEMPSESFGLTPQSSTEQGGDEPVPAGSGGGTQDHGQSASTTTPLAQFEQRLVRCPDCSCVFDPYKHQEKQSKESDLINGEDTDPLS